MSATKPDFLCVLSKEEREEIDRIYSTLGQVNFYEMLGVSRDVDAKAIERAHADKRAKLQPERWAGKPLGPYRRRVSEIVERLDVAKRTLTSADARAKYDGTLRPLPEKRERHKSIEDLLNETLEAMPSESSESKATQEDSASAATPPQRAPETAIVKLAQEAKAAAATSEAVTTARATVVSTDAVIVDELPNAPARLRRTAMWALGAAVCAASLALALTWNVRAPHADAPIASKTLASLSVPFVAPQAPAPPSPPPAVAAPQDAPPAIASAASAAASASTLGRIQVQRAGRRVFVDGRVVGEGPGTFVVTCGRHKVRIGSTGASDSVDVPCGGDLVLGRGVK